MPRRARVVAPGVAHHVTQLGVARRTVFYARRDRQVYLKLLAEQARLAGVRVLAYCFSRNHLMRFRAAWERNSYGCWPKGTSSSRHRLMSNHIHLVLVSDEERSLALCLQRVHGRYAQYLNARRRRSGHLWQNRYFSCPLDEGHLWTAVRYVELNPVRAGLAKEASSYRWSSAAAHLGGRDESQALDVAFWREAGGAGRWRQLLDEQGDEERLRRLRRATYACRPCGDKSFVATWGQRRSAVA